MLILATFKYTTGRNHKQNGRKGTKKRQGRTEGRGEVEKEGKKIGHMAEKPLKRKKQNMTKEGKTRERDLVHEMKEGRTQRGKQRKEAKIKDKY